jgi:transcriptional regulator with XRE-family HTH domain
MRDPECVKLGAALRAERERQRLSQADLSRASGLHLTSTAAIRARLARSGLRGAGRRGLTPTNRWCSNPASKFSQTWAGSITPPPPSPAIEGQQPLAA